MWENSEKDLKEEQLLAERACLLLKDHTKLEN